MITICLNCNKEFEAKKSRLISGKRISCSIQCSISFKKKKNLNEKCIICSKDIHIKPFHRKKYKGPFCCSKECRFILCKDLYKGNKNPNFKHSNSILKFLITRTRDIKSRSKLKKLNFNLTENYLYEIYLKQNGLCFYSGIPMKLDRGNFKTKGQADIDALSVDRIIPEKGYIIDNIVLCCNGINKLKGNDDQNNLSLFLNKLSLKSFGTCRINVKKIRENAIMPNRSKFGDAGFDITASYIEETDTQIKVYTGLAIQPDLGWYCLVYPRSSISKKGLFLSNSVGIIDNQYTGEIIAIFNKTNNLAKIEIGERIIQLVPQKLILVNFEEVDSLIETDRGTGGFGSTGI